MISTIGGLFGVWLINQNWYKRQEFKYKYLLKRQRLSAKGKIAPHQIPEEKSALGTLSSLIPLLKNLDADQLGALVEKFTGEGPEPEGESSIDMLMGFAEKNPEIVQGLIEGLTKGKTDQTENPLNYR